MLLKGKMKYLLKKILQLLLLLLIYINSSSKINSVYSNIIDEKVYIVKHEWHTGIILNRTTAEKYLPLLKDEYKNFNFIEIGWGDKDFYMTEKETFWLGLKAALWPTKSVIHINTFNLKPDLYYNRNEIIRLSFTETEYKALLGYINERIYIDEKGNYMLLSDKDNINSRFYLSNEKYFLFKTCNVWIAKALKEAGISIKPIFALTSKNVMKQLKKMEK